MNNQDTQEAAANLLKLARQLDDENCMDFPVKWVADEIRRIVEGAAK